MNKPESRKTLANRSGYCLGLECAAFAMVSLLTGCPSTQITKPVTVNSQNEAAAILVSPTSVMPWNQIADAMQPNFALTGDQAVQQVLPTTERISEQVLSAFGASLGVGLPQTFKNATNSTSTTATTTTTGVNTPPTVTGSNKNSSTTTDTEQPGTAPTPPSGIPAGGQLPAAPSVTGDIGLDPILRYQTGLALFETVQMLNREVQSAAILSNAVPFVVRLKVAVLPYRPNLAYSLHLRISFFPNRRCGSGPVPSIAVAAASPGTAGIEPQTQQPTCDWYPQTNRPPQVIPLLAADDVERALKSRAVEVAQQVGLALSAMTNGIGASAGINKANQSLTAISGQDLNSRLTIARQSDNTLYVKIGATNEATAGAGLVGQTYDIAVLLLVPREYFNDSATPPRPVAPQIRIVTHTQFRNAFDGTVLPDRPVPTLVQQFDSVMKQVLPDTNNPQYLEWTNLSDLDKEKVARAFASPIQMSNYDVYSKLFVGKIAGTQFSLESPACAADNPAALQSGACNSEYWKRQNVWTAASTILADTAMKSAFFELHWPQSIRLPQQTALVQDDTKDKAVVQLWGVGGVSATTLAAKLELVLKGQANPVYSFAAQSISLDSIAHTLTLTFPSPAKWGVAEIDPSDAHNKLSVAQLPCSAESLCPEVTDESGTPTAAPHTYPVLIAKASSDAKPNVSVTAAVTQVVAVRGTGSIVISIDKLKDDSVTLTLTGADVVSVVDSTGKPLPMSSQGLTLKTAGAVTFRLTNLHVGTPVVVSAEGKKGASSTGKTSLQFEVAAN